MEVNEEQAEISLVGRMLIELVSRGKRPAQGSSPVLGRSRNRPEPTGYDYAVANFIPLPNPRLNAFSQAPDCPFRRR